MGKFTSLACRGVQRRSLWQGQLITDQRWQPTCCQSLYGSPGASWQDKRSGTRCLHMDLLSAEGKKAINKCEAVVGIRNVYDYLIHDTEDCRKKGKEQYDPSERITGNNFDIGAYEQLGTAEKNEMFLEMGQAIREHGFTNYMDFYEFVVDTYEDMNYIEVMRCYSGHFERMTRGNYQRWEQGQRGLRPSQAQHHASTTKTTPDCCPACGSIDIKKSGKTLANTQRWACKDCGKKFV